MGADMLTAQFGNLPFLFFHSPTCGKSVRLQQTVKNLLSQLNEQWALSG